MKINLRLFLRPAWVLAGLVIFQSPSVYASRPPYFETWPRDLQRDVTKEAKRFKGDFALYVKDLRSGVRFEHHAATPMYLASGIKLVVMAAVFDAIKQGRLTLDEKLRYRPVDVRPGSPILNFIDPGTQLSVNRLLSAMVQHSDNAATDLLINRLGLPQVNQVYITEGIDGFGPITTLLDVRRLVYRHLDPSSDQLSPQQIFRLGLIRPLPLRLAKMEEMLNLSPNALSPEAYGAAFRAYYREGYNSATMEAMGLLLERIAKKQLVSPPAAQQMTEIMLETKTGTRRVRAGLPPKIKWAHKTGTQYRRTCDFGFFFREGDALPIVFAISVEGSTRTAEALIARLAKATYQRLYRSGAAKPKTRSVRIKRRQNQDLLPKTPPPEN